MNKKRKWQLKRNTNRLKVLHGWYEVNKRRE